MGETVQIPLDNKTIDFKLPCLWWEHHPLIHSHAWRDRSALHDMERHLREVPKELRTRIWNTFRDELAANYYRSRRDILDLTGHRGEPLVVTQNAKDVLELMQRVGGQPIIRADFMKLWNSGFLRS